MTRLGTAELWTPNGWIEVEVYDPATVSESPIELWTPNGWGTPHLAAPSTADTPIEVYTPSGWRGISSTGFELIDDFESSAMDDAWNLSEPSGLDATSSRAAYQGSYGARFASGSFGNMLAHENYSNNLPYYPQPGDKFDVHVRGRNGAFESGDAPMRPLQFGIQTIPSESDDNWGTADFDYHYTVWIRQDVPNPRLQVGKQKNNSSAAADSHFMPDGTFVDDQWYRIEADWHYTTSGEIKARAWEVHSDGSETRVTDGNGNPLEPSLTDSEFSQGGIALSAPDETHMDWAKKTEPL